MLEMSVRELFPTPIWQMDLPHEQAASLNARLLAAIEAIVTPRPELKPGANWQTDPILHERAEFAELARLIESGARGIADFLKLKARDLVLTGCWANINPPGGRNSSHTHPNNFLSGVYYVSTPPGEGRIEFADPRPQAFVMMPHVQSFGPYTGNSVTVDVVPGRLIFFPAWLSHAVPMNRSSEERVSIAFNLMFKAYVEQASPPLWQGTVAVRATGG
jgi:uncharacterized protein (TIGR02466 family)